MTEHEIPSSLPLNLSRPIHQDFPSHPRRNILNINVGILGHVDSGKTSLAKAMSSVASTAAFDKNPQSVERGITLDLGFSSLVCHLTQADVVAAEGGDEMLASVSYQRRLPKETYDRYVKDAEVDSVQFTLVDCPGHASLIRTVIGGASIVDVMMLVIDATKGIQTQTAECIVLGEVLGRRLVVVLNKVDLIRPPQSLGSPEADEVERRSMLEKMKLRLRKVFSQTRWPNVTFIEAAAAPSANPNPNPISTNDDTPEEAEPDLEADLESRIEQKKQLLDEEAKARKVAKKKNKSSKGNAMEPSTMPVGMDLIVDHLLQVVDPVEVLRARNVAVRHTLDRDASPTLQNQLLQTAKSNFIMYVDHCFAVKGQGTVLTGTIASGMVSVGDEILFPDLQITKKVKSLQVFHQPVTEAKQGDRLGLCVSGLDPTLIERGIICSASAASNKAFGNTSHHFRCLSEWLGISQPPPQLSHLLAASECRIITANCFIAAVRKVRFYKQPLLTNSGHKYHITVGHHTTMGTLRYFGAPNPYVNTSTDMDQRGGQSSESEAVRQKAQEASLLQLSTDWPSPSADIVLQGNTTSDSKLAFPFGFRLLDELIYEESNVQPKHSDSTSHRIEEKYWNSILGSAVATPSPQRSEVTYAIVQLDSPIVISSTVSGESLEQFIAGPGHAQDGLVAVRPGTVLLASRLDTDLKSNSCRLAVQGTIVSVLANWTTNNAATKAGGAKAIAQPPAPQVRNTVTVSDPSTDLATAIPAPPRPILGSHLSCSQADLLHHYLFTAYRHIHWRSLPIFKAKRKAMPVDKILDDHVCIVKVPPKVEQLPEAGTVALATDVAVFVSQRVYCLMTRGRGRGAGVVRGGRAMGSASEATISSTGSEVTSTTSVEWGCVESTFGQNNNKLRVRFDAPVYARGGQRGRAARDVVLPYNRYPFAAH